MHEHTDAHGVIKVRIDGTDVDSVVLTSRWREFYDAQTLAETLTEIIRAELPPAFVVDDIAMPENLPSGPMDPAKWRAFWDEFNLYQEAVVRHRARAAAGELLEWNPPTEASDDRKHVGVEFVGGRFQAVHIDPRWAEKASLQDLSNRISTALQQHPMTNDRPIDPDRQAMADHGANFMRILAGN